MEVVDVMSGTCGVRLVDRLEGVRDVLALKGGIKVFKPS